MTLWDSVSNKALLKQNFSQLKNDPFPADPKEDVPEIISKPEPEFKDTIFIVKYNEKWLLHA